MMIRYIALFCGVTLFACASHNYVFEPAAQATAQIAGRAAANYQIPPELPQGDVRIATFGIMSLRPQGAPENAVLRALHVRMVVANNGDQPWTVDTRQQRAVLAGRRVSESRPALAAVPGGGAPIVTIDPGSARTIDLLFPLPADMQDAEKIPLFDVIWQVQTASRVVTERTPFERVELVPYYAPDPYLTYGGWYDPMYGSGMFYGARPLPPVYWQRPIVVGPPPARRVR